MIRNEAGWDRMARVLVGILGLSLVFLGPKTGWGLLGVIPLLTGLMRVPEHGEHRFRPERALRPAVCMRKGDIERMLTTVTTLQQQQRNVLDFLTEAMRAHLQGQAAPSRLPVS